MEKFKASRKLSLLFALLLTVGLHSLAYAETSSSDDQDSDVDVIVEVTIIVEPVPVSLDPDEEPVEAAEDPES